MPPQNDNQVIYYGVHTQQSNNQSDISALLDKGIFTMRENHPTDEHFNSLDVN